jgi:L-fuculose-phosphate aldolase
MRQPDGYAVLITPMGGELETISSDDMVVIDTNGEPIEEEQPPSSESALHLEVYRRRPEINAVVHVHPVFATAVSIAVEELPPIIDEAIMKIGGGVRRAEYAFPGTEELAQRACEALGERMAVLLPHHGLLSVGLDVKSVVETAILVERLAQIFLYTSMLGSNKILPEQASKIEREIFLMKMAAARASGGLSGNSP